MQYTIIGEPSKGRFYPLYRERDGEEWQYFTILGIQIYYDEWSEANTFIGKEPGPNTEDEFLAALIGALKKEGMIEEKGDQL